MSEWQKEKAELINKQQELEARLDRMERQDKRTNIVITGIDQIKGKPAEVKSAVNDLLTKQLKCEVQLMDAFQIKTKAGEAKIVARVASVEDKRMSL